jgi:hypothetical protein
MAHTIAKKSTETNIYRTRFGGFFIAVNMPFQVNYRLGHLVKNRHVDFSDVYLLCSVRANPETLAERCESLLLNCNSAAIEVNRQT